MNECRHPIVQTPADPIPGVALQCCTVSCGARWALSEIPADVMADIERAWTLAGFQGALAMGITLILERTDVQ